MRIIVSGYFLRDVFVKRGNRFLPRKGFLLFYYNPVCKEKRACSKSRHTLIILLIHLFLLSAFFFQSQTFIKCCSTGFRLSKEKINAYVNRTTERSALIRYFDRVLRYTEPLDERIETEKDIWRLDKLGIEFRKLPIRNTQTLNFTKILQDDIRNQVKKATCKFQ